MAKNLRIVKKSAHFYELSNIFVPLYRANKPTNAAPTRVSITGKAGFRFRR